MPFYQLLSIKKDYLIGIWRLEDEKNMENKKLWREKQSNACHQTIGHLCQKLDIPFSSIKKNKHQKPYLTHCNYHISFSHCYYFSVAALHLRKTIGIDIEKKSSKVEKVATKFLQKKEQLLAQNSTYRFTAMWCVKEALYKIYSQEIKSIKNDVVIDLLSQSSCSARVYVKNKIIHHTLAIKEIQDFLLVYPLL